MEIIASIINNEYFIVVGTSILGLLFVGKKLLKKISIRHKGGNMNNAKQKQSQGNQQNGNNNINMNQGGCHNKQAGRDIRG